MSDQVAFERVFSWLDVGIKSNALFANSVATNLTGWDPTNLVFDFGPQVYLTPYVVNQTVNVGDRILQPSTEIWNGTNYWAGYILQTNGNSFNPDAYIDPFVAGFDQANLGSIIPVNAIPGSNTLEVWWFRINNANGAEGFLPTYWPSVVGNYTLQWPTNARQIILASNAGSGPLDDLEANGDIYVQNDPTQPGYNPNEEHAMMLGGQAYALRDDLNITNANGYSSAPYVLHRVHGHRRPPLHERVPGPARGPRAGHTVRLHCRGGHAPARNRCRCRCCPARRRLRRQRGQL